MNKNAKKARLKAHKLLAKNRKATIRGEQIAATLKHIQKRREKGVRYTIHNHKRVLINDLERELLEKLVKGSSKIVRRLKQIAA